jgi:hypothetical protein
MSQSKFTSANAPALEAVGRVNTGGRKLPLTLTIDNDTTLYITNTDEFRLTVRVADIVNRPREETDDDPDMRVYSDNVECILDDGTFVLCEGTIDPDAGRIRLDAIDQENLSWFWVEVRQNFRCAFLG